MSLTINGADWPRPPRTYLIDLSDFHERIARLQTESIALIQLTTEAIRRTQEIIARCRAGGPSRLAGRVGRLVYFELRGGGGRRPRPRRRLPVPLVDVRRDDVPEQGAENHQERLGGDCEHGQACHLLKGDADPDAVFEMRPQVGLLDGGVRGRDPESPARVRRPDG